MKQLLSDFLLFRYLGNRYDVLKYVISSCYRRFEFSRKQIFVGKPNNKTIIRFRHLLFFCTVTLSSCSVSRKLSWIADHLPLFSFFVNGENCNVMENCWTLRLFESRKKLWELLLCLSMS